MQTKSVFSKRICAVFWAAAVAGAAASTSHKKAPPAPLSFSSAAHTRDAEQFVGMLGISLFVTLLLAINNS
jgi:hypothetical protein